MIYYISDLHFGHLRCIKMDKRPFSSIEEMDRILIENWNNKVNEEDDVYILGDFSYKSKIDPVEYLKQLKGHKHLIVGNHDLKLIKNQEACHHFETIDYYLQIEDQKELSIFVICHLLNGLIIKEIPIIFMVISTMIEEKLFSLCQKKKEPLMQDV